MLKKTIILSVVASFSTAVSETEHYVPSDKNLSPEWIDALTARGERPVFRGEQLETIGMPVGGIGAGQLYVRGDGTLARWWIFNENNTTDFRAADPNTGYRTYRPASRLEQGVAIAVTTADGKTVSLPLSREGFDDISFIGEYPVAELGFSGPKKEFPLDVSARFFSPIVPLEIRDSAHPATVLSYTISNPGDDEAEVTLGAWLEHAAMINADGSVAAQRRSRFREADGLSTVQMDLIPLAGDESKEEISVEIFEDFEAPILREDGTSVEKGALDKWTVEGFGFGDKAVAAKAAGVTNGGDSHLVSTLADRHAVGRLLSEEFTVKEPWIGFRSAGKSLPLEGLDTGAGIALLVDGKRVMSSTGNGSRALRRASWDVSSFVGQKAQIEIIDSSQWGGIAIDDIVFASGNPALGSEFPSRHREFGDMTLALRESADMGVTNWSGYSTFLEEMSGELAKDTETTTAITEKPVSALGKRFTLQPGESRTVEFIISWYFPNFHDGRKGNPGNEGRMYANWYESSLEAAEDLHGRLDDLAATTELFRKTLYSDTTLPHWFVQRSSASMANLASNTLFWWENGRFYASEGVWFCHGTCGHVWNYAQTPGRLFPQIERSMRTDQDFNLEVGQATSGRINFRGYQHEDESFKNWGYIPDAQAGYILKVYREHLVSPDEKFLTDLYPRVKAAMAYLHERDGRHGELNGVLEGLQHLTDSLGWGPSSFTQSLYLAALRAMEEMAKLQGDDAFAKSCRDLYLSGKTFTDDELWNGEFYVHNYEPAPDGGLWEGSTNRAASYENGVLGDMVFGQNWAHQLNLGYVMDKEKVRKGLEAVWKYNWTPDVATVYAVMKRRFILLANEGEPGLIGITYPNGGMPKNRIGQNDDPWTGYEYQAASGMLWEGLITEGLSIAYGVHQRYQPEKHNPWNEIEGGDHYSRSMSAWGLMLAASGFHYDGPRGEIGFAPQFQQDDFKSFFSGAQGWGSISQKRNDGTQTNTISLKYGSLKVNRVKLTPQADAEMKTVRAVLNGKEIECQMSQQEGEITIDLQTTQELDAGDELQIVLD